MDLEVIESPLDGHEGRVCMFFGVDEVDEAHAHWKGVADKLETPEVRFLRFRRPHVSLKPTSE